MTTAKKQTYPIRAEFNEVLTKEFLQNGDFDTAKLTMRDVANAMIEYIGENEHSGDCKLKDLRKLAEGFADFFLFLGFEATNSK